jgi:putative pyruvate formate lyase activating enzyme
MSTPKATIAPMAAAVEPAYLRLHRTGELATVLAGPMLASRAVTCARTIAGSTGRRRSGAPCAGPATGPSSRASAPSRRGGAASGRRGSGTIFFGWCNLRCVYCQNWEISQRATGVEVAPSDLAAMMLELQSLGCHNVNLVSPSHVVAQVIEAVAIAAGLGLTLPIVYNTGGYDSSEALALLDRIVDIYMPDMKYGDAAPARRYSTCRDYVAVNRAAVLEMHRQVGDLECDERGIATHGLLVRHLVLPGGLAGTAAVLEFLASKVSRDSYLNLMDQYRPAYRTREHPELDRPLTRAEYHEALAIAAGFG